MSNELRVKIYYSRGCGCYVFKYKAEIYETGCQSFLNAIDFTKRCFETWQKDGLLDQETEFE